MTELTQIFFGHLKKIGLRPKKNWGGFCQQSASTELPPPPWARRQTADSSSLTSPGGPDGRGRFGHSNSWRDGRRGLVGGAGWALSARRRLGQRVAIAFEHLWRSKSTGWRFILNKAMCMCEMLGKKTEFPKIGCKLVWYGIWTVLNKKSDRQLGCPNDHALNLPYTE